MLLQLALQVMVPRTGGDLDVRGEAFGFSRLLRVRLGRGPSLLLPVRMRTVLLANLSVHPAREVRCPLSASQLPIVCN